MLIAMLSTNTTTRESKIILISKEKKIEKKIYIFYLTGFEPVPPGILLSSVRL